MSASQGLRAIVAENRAGKPRGIPSWCTAHAPTLRAILDAFRHGEDLVLIEATCNQVNHRGGYTGMTPADFRRFVEAEATAMGVAPHRLVFGGDHLGPNPWRHRPAAEAMDEARAMVKAYVEAGFTKIHLDASMRCADDKTLPEETSAARAAALCAVAESAAPELSYVIGTEVPVPGGETTAAHQLEVTNPQAVRNTFETHRRLFRQHGLEAAFEKVIGIVVQPGVDFSNTRVFAFDEGRAQGLARSIGALQGCVFEAHSTDYQSAAALAALVKSHFAILKVGPELTFAYREALFAMLAIEQQLAPANPSGLAATIDRVLDADDRHWRPYVDAGEDPRLARLFGLSDRVRYYWADPAITAAIARLTANIDEAAIPPGLLLQYAGFVPPGGAEVPLSQAIVRHKVGAVVARYRQAC